jgi:glutaredoxin-related protein
LNTLPDLIGDLENLENLNLYDNDLVSIPESLANLTKLKTIDLRRQSGDTKDSNSLQDLPLGIFKNTTLLIYSCLYAHLLSDTMFRSLTYFNKDLL